MDVTSPRFACHHRRIRSGSVYARHTRCRGAANSRTTRIWVSLGVLTAARLPAVVAMAVLLREFLQHLVQGGEALGPELFERAEPFVDGLQRPVVEPVHPLS